MVDRVPQTYAWFARWFERLLALGVISGVIVSAVGSAYVLVDMDWRTTAALDEMVHRVLLLVIGLELVRMLVTHDLLSAVELLAFVVARKMLRPEITSTDIALGILAFVALLLARRYAFVLVCPPEGGAQPRDETVQPGTLGSRVVQATQGLFGGLKRDQPDE